VSRHAVRSPAGLAAVGLAVAALLGCRAEAPTATAPATAAPAPPTPAAGSFRSVRTPRTVAPPVRLRIPAAGVDTPLERLGRAADGTMGLPSRPAVAGWYAEGPRPGQPGPAVVVGHVDTGSGPGVFFRLAELRRGDPVSVERADGSTARFRVTRLTRVPKSRFPTEAVYAPSLEPSLRLVTCGGTFERAVGHYRDNVIVFAVPA
jgi:hypothetical protein